MHRRIVLLLFVNVAVQAQGLNWDVQTRRDKMTGKPSIQASSLMRVEGGAGVLVTASCGMADEVNNLVALPDKLMSGLMKGLGASTDAAGTNQAPGRKVDARALAFEFDYKPARGSRLGLLRSQVTQHVSVDSYGNGTVSPPRWCTFLDVMVDDTGRSGVQSDLCRENAASVSFLSFRMRELTRAMLPGADSGFTKLLGGLMDSFSELSDPTIATMDEVFRSREVRVQLPLTDDDTVLLAIHPQDPGFQKFVSACNSQFPPMVRDTNQHTAPPAPVAAARTEAERQPVPTARPVIRPGTTNADTTPPVPTVRPPSAPPAVAVLSIRGQFSRSLTWGHYWLLRDDPSTALAQGGIPAPNGVAAGAVIRSICRSDEVGCKRITRALDANGAAKAYADARGNGTFPGVPPGHYYLMVSAAYNNRLVIWSQRLELGPGAHSIVLGDFIQFR